MLRGSLIVFYPSVFAIELMLSLNWKGSLGSSRHFLGSPPSCVCWLFCRCVSSPFWKVDRCVSLSLRVILDFKRKHRRLYMGRTRSHGVQAIFPLQTFYFLNPMFNNMYIFAVAGIWRHNGISRLVSQNIGKKEILIETAAVIEDVTWLHENCYQMLWRHFRQKTPTGSICCVLLWTIFTDLTETC